MEITISKTWEGEYLATGVNKKRSVTNSIVIGDSEIFVSLKTQCRELFCGSLGDSYFYLLHVLFGHLSKEGLL